jgi:hypothetical protein
MIHDQELDGAWFSHKLKTNLAVYRAGQGDGVVDVILIGRVIDASGPAMRDNQFNSLKISGKLMKADLALLTVSRVIIHEVPHRRENTAPVLSEIESPMDADIRQLIKERIIATVGDPTKSFEIEPDPQTTSPVPGLIAAHLTTSPADVLVENSQAMAQHLFTTQPTTSPGGLLLVILGTIAENPAVIILKLEKEEGARIVPHPAAGGKRTFDIKHYKDLILTPKTKVFKIALFTPRFTASRPFWKSLTVSLT